MQEKEKPDQFIAVYFSQIESFDAALSYALPLARVLDKGIVFLHVQDPKYVSESISPELAKEKIQQAERLISSYGILSEYYLLEGKTSEILKGSIEKLNVICLITGINTSKKGKKADAPEELLKNLEYIKTAYLLAPEPLSDEKLLKNIAFTIDFEKESKEKIPWASYFGRFNRSLIYVCYPEYKDDYLSRSTQENLRFVKKMFEELNVNYVVEEIGRVNYSSTIDMEAIKRFENNRIGLLIAVSTRGKTVIDFLRFRPEYKTIRNPYKIPVLMLNPREDIYVLCD